MSIGRSRHKNGGHSYKFEGAPMVKIKDFNITSKNLVEVTSHSVLYSLQYSRPRLWATDNKRVCALSKNYASIFKLALSLCDKREELQVINELHTALYPVSSLTMKRCILFRNVGFSLTKQTAARLRPISSLVSAMLRSGIGHSSVSNSSIYSWANTVDINYCK